MTSNAEVGVVARSLVDAYRRTEFRVADRGWAFVLRDGEHSPVLAACHESFGVTRSAYITAWNPHSEPQPPEANKAAQARLEADLVERGLPFLRGLGVNPTGHWPGETSLLMLGISGDDARRLGRAYGQNAIVVAGRDAVGRVVMVKPEGL